MVVKIKYVIHGDKITATKAIKEYIYEKLDKLNVYFENSNEVKANVNIRVKNLDQIIEVTIPTKKFIIRAEEASKDLYAAIDKVSDKLIRQLNKNKEKIKNKYKNDIEKFDLVFDKFEEDQDDLKIVKRKTLDNKPMDEEEALIQMKLLNHDFFVFNNIDENCFSVIYKRKDNTFGIINVK